MFSGPQKVAIAANSILPTLATAAVGLRLLVLRRTIYGIGASEYAILLAVIVAVGDCALGLYATCSGILGVRLDGLPLPKFQEYLLIVYIDILLCHIIYGVIKISILLFYKRIFPTEKFQIHANVLIGIVSAFTVAITIVQIFTATPIQAAWMLKTYGPGHYNYSHPAFLVAAAAIDIVFDLWTLALPFPVISRLQVAKTRRIGIFFVFLLGTFCIVSSAVRLYYVVELLFIYSHNPEKARDVANNNDIWAHVEACASIITACLPTLAPLYRRIGWVKKSGTIMEEWIVAVEEKVKHSWSRSTKRSRNTKVSESLEELNQL